MANDNTAIWDVLSVTDPRHTKPFNRAGGFKGKSVKPIYTSLKMTEMFGPCGIGWGFSEPNFQLVNGPEGTVLVYCSLTLWYVNPTTGQKSEPVPGIGGDFAVVKQQSGLRADDEAFKKATTDAIGNAMKHIGMSADIHMGQHDDDKYVTTLRQQFEDEERAAANDRKSDAREQWLKQAIEFINAAKTKPELEQYASTNKTHIDALDDDRYVRFKDAYGARLKAIKAAQVSEQQIKEAVA